MRGQRGHQIKGRCGTRYCYVEGCRCGKCKRANAEYCRKASERRSKTEPPSHGTLNAYVNYRCRCTECRNANNVACARRAERRRATT